MTEIRLTTIGVVARVQMAWAMFWNFFRVLIFGEIKLRFEQEGDPYDDYE